MKTNLLSEDAFKATFIEPLQNITGAQREVIDIWPYIDSIPKEETQEYKISDEAEYVWRTGDGQFDHVCVMTNTRNVYLIVIVDLFRQQIYGHRLLDLNKEYGLTD